LDGQNITTLHVYPNMLSSFIRQSAAPVDDYNLQSISQPLLAYRFLLAYRELATSFLPGGETL